MVEVLVALCVFSFFVVSTGHFFRAFHSLRARERASVMALVAATDYVEKAVVEPPRCIDTSFVVAREQNVMLSVGQTVLPGRAGLLWLSVEPVAAPAATLSGPVRLGRLVYCRQNRALR